MAGIRAGFPLARPGLLLKMGPYGAGMLPITGLACATASLRSRTLVAERRAINKKIRENTFEFLSKKGVEVGRPDTEFAKAMADNKVFIGRMWPAWPTKVRVAVGTQAEMDKFKSAYDKVAG